MIKVCTNGNVKIFRGAIQDCYRYMCIKKLSKIKLYCYGNNKLGRRVYYTRDLGLLRKWYVVIFIPYKRLTTAANQCLLQIPLGILQEYNIDNI